MNQQAQRILKDMAAQALAVQDASNLVAVLNSYIFVLKALRSIYPNEDDSYIYNHPISKVWVDKINSLTGQFASQLKIVDWFNQVEKLSKS